jgi:predicted phage replisome organizer
MSDVKWIKISTNIFDDEKIKLIETLPDSDTLIIIWFKLLSMAGRCNDSGMIYLTRDVPYNEEMLSTIMRRPVNTVRLAMNEFQKLGMIHIVNNYIAILNWEKHQNIDGLDRIRENTRLRVQNWRKNHKQLPCNVTVTDGNAPEKSRVEKSREDKNKKKEGRFTPPTPAEVQAYLDEIGNHTINRDSFMDYYESKGWMIGRNKMKDWRAAVRTWARRDKEGGQDKKGWPML